MAQPNILILMRADAQQAISTIQRVSGALSVFGAQVNRLSGMASQSITGLRQMAQGVQNLGFVLTGFIGIPMAMALRNIANEAMTFERQMVEVQKTTGLSTEAIGTLAEKLRELALQTPSSAVELATLAAEAGRIGVGFADIMAGNIDVAIAKIHEFVRVVDMMVISTTLGAEEAAKAFGRFLSVFKDLDISDLEKLGSAINELGQAFSVNEQEIVSAMMRIAPAAATLDIPAQYVAALATAIVQMSESASRGGTRLRRSLEEMGLNFENLGKLIGLTSKEMNVALNENALVVFEKLVYAISEIEDNQERMFYATKLFGTVGGNAIMRLAGNWEELERAIGIAGKAYDEGTSLQTEFNRALTATSEQLKILKNHLLEIGKTFMEDLLPLASEIIGALLPALKMVTEWVRNLTIEQKLLVLGIAGLLTVGFPLLALLGSFGFAMSMVLNGIINLVGGLFGLLGVIGSIIATGGGLTVLFGVLAGLLGVTLIAAIANAAGVFDILLEKLRDLADKARDWGGSFIAELAGGIVSAAATVLVAAMEFVGSIISAFLEPGSPPKIGPLRNMDKWGGDLMTTFLRGFKNADFGVLRDVSNIIKRVLQHVVPDAAEGGKAMVAKMQVSARELIAEVIYRFNKTGQVANDVLAKLSSMLGDVGDDVVKLIRLQLQYNKALQELERIRAMQRDIDEAYQAEIRAIQARNDLAAAEKMSLIRQARERKNLSLANAETEEQAANRNVEGLREQVDWQREYLNAMLDQKDAVQAIADALSGLVSAVRKVGKQMKDALADLLAKLAINLKMQELYNERGMDTTGLLREELNIRKRIVAEILKLENPTAEQLSMLEENLDRIKELEGILGKEGIKIPGLDMSEFESDQQKVMDDIAALGEAFENIRNIFSEGEDNFRAFMRGMAGAELPEGMVMGMSESERRFYSWGETVGGWLDTITSKIEAVKSVWNTLADSIGTSIDKIKTAIFGGGDEEAAGWLAGVGIGGGGGGVIGVISSVLSTYGELVGKLVGGIAEAVAASVDAIVEALGGIDWPSLFSWWTEEAPALEEDVKELGAAFESIASSIESITSAFASFVVPEEIDFEAVLGPAAREAAAYLELITTAVEKWLGLSAKYASGFAKVLGEVAGAVDWLVEKLFGIELGLKGFVDSFSEVDDAKVILTSALKGMKDSILGLIFPISNLTETWEEFFGEGGVLEKAWDFIWGLPETEFGKKAAQIKADIENAAGLLVGVADPILEALLPSPSEINEAFQIFINTVWTNFSNIATELRTLLENIFGAGEGPGILDAFIPTPGEINQYFQDAVREIFDGIAGLRTTLSEAAMGGLGLLEMLLPSPGAVIDSVNAAFGHIGEQILSVIDVAGIIAGIASIPETIAQAFSPGNIIALAGQWSPAILEMLTGVANDILTWINETLIPTFDAGVLLVTEFLVPRLQAWAEAFRGLWRTITTGLWLWIVTGILPYLNKLITLGLGIFDRIKSEWKERIGDGLEEVRLVFDTVFTKIGELIERIIKGAINAIIDMVEEGINNVIDGINSLIERVNKVLREMHMPTFGKIKNIRLKRLAEGGIVLDPMLAIVGDVPEAVIPLHRLDEMFVGGGGQAPVYITIENPIVRNDDDLRQMIDAINLQMGRELSGRMDLLGRNRGY